ncbi:MAG: hypothetical protein ABIQ64_02975 [Candidatus Saccharimonadales bacterium]
MDDQPDIYKQFPYGEVQRRLSDETIDRLWALISTVDDPTEGDSVDEVITDTVVKGKYHMISTCMEAFTTMIPDMHSVLVEHQQIPDYLKDTLQAMIQSVQSTPNLTLRSQSSIIQNADISDYIQLMWASTEVDRLTSEEVALYSSDTAKDGTVRIVLKKNAMQAWALGVSYSELRTYELQNGKYFCRMVGEQLFVDPVGTEEDATNSKDGMYLPSRLRLPNMTTSVTV